MYGSCCEEQEAKEAEVRSRLRAATAVNESRMMKGHLLRENMRRALHFCEDATCTHEHCGECIEEDDEAAPPPAAAADATTSNNSDQSDDDDDFSDDEEILAKMRAQRMGQLRVGAEVASRQRAARGVHHRMGDGESVDSLLSDASDPSPIVLHLGLMEDDRSSETCVWVEQTLRALAARLPMARLVTHVCATRSLPDGLPSELELPALLVAEKGLITSVCRQRLGALREQPDVHEAVSRWLEQECGRLLAARGGRRPARANDGEEAPGDESDEDEDGGADTPATGSYCGRPGCRAYPHEHDAGAVLRDGGMSSW